MTQPANTAQQPKKYKKYRKFEIVLHDLAEIDRVIKLEKELCNEQGYITFYSNIIHDKDVYTKGVDDPTKIPVGKKFGDLKALHSHIGFVWITPTTFSAVAKKFGVPENAVERIKAPSFSSYQAYQIHRNAPLKHQYPVTDVDTNVKGFAEEVNKRMIIKDMRSLSADYLYYLHEVNEGNIRPEDIGGKLPLDMYAQKSNVFDKAFMEVATKESKLINKKGEVERNILFVTGASGSGKSYYAKGIARKRGLEYFVSSASDDILDGYRLEPCILLDDARGSNFKYEQFLKLTDPHTISKFHSRFSDKLPMAKLFIITSVQSLDEFIDSIPVPKGKEEDPTQVKRRINAIYTVHKDTVDIAVRKGIDTFVKYKTVPNPIAEKLKEEKEKKDTFNPDDFIW